jgi:hypothetical protein
MLATMKDLFDDDDSSSEDEVAPLNEQVSEHATATPPPYVTSPGPQ